MAGQAHGNLKYPESRLIRTSADLGWSSLGVDLRAHETGEGRGAIGANVEVALVIRGSSDGLVTCKVGGAYAPVQPTAGTIWLNPVGAKCDEMHIASPELQVLHLYVPTSAFARLSEEFSLPHSPGQAIRYASGVNDDVIRHVGVSVLSEMERPTAAGRMLVDTSSLFLAARLMHAHCEFATANDAAPDRRPLDRTRFNRVLAYIEEHFDEDVSVADLAEVACLSVFHFTRAFAAATGSSPHRYLSQRRLEAAKQWIATGRRSLSEIAFQCQFSSQASFTRAFKRATGMTPADYRRMVR